MSCACSEGPGTRWYSWYPLRTRTIRLKRVQRGQQECLRAADENARSGAQLCFPRKDRYCTPSKTRGLNRTRKRQAKGQGMPGVSPVGMAPAQVHQDPPECLVSLRSTALSAASHCDETD